MENKKQTEKEQDQENAQNGNDIAFVAVEENISSSGFAKKDRVLPISILIAAVMIAGALVFATIYKGDNSGAVVGAGNNGGAAAGGAAAGGTGAVAPSSASTTAILALNSRDAILGNANAPVTIIEYGDYQCPYCAQFFSTIQPSIIQNYVNTGEARVVFRDLPFLGPESVAAANAAQCAEDQNKLWAYHDALYNAKLADDAKGGGEDDGTLSRTLFMSIATKLGMDTSAFASCIDASKDASIVTQEKADAEVIVGGDSTPATVVNGVLVADANGASVGDNATAVLNAIAAAVAKTK
jgi:protein-disulfide isomerase